MTREQQIEKAATAKSRGETPYYYEAFVEGAKWADEHPQDPWISIEDARPALLEFVLYCDEDGEYYTEVPQNEDVKITHWMYIPYCPPLQAFCNKLKKLLDTPPTKEDKQ